MTRAGVGYRREYREIPPLVSGYPLENVRVSFYKPRAGVNLWTNPSIETDTTGYTAVGGSIAQSALRQRFGVYSLEVTPSSSSTSGVYAGTVDLASGQLYIASVFGYFVAGHPYKLYFANTSGTQLGTAYEFYGRGRWERVWVMYVETSTASRRVYVTKNGGTSLQPFYLDGLQVEVDKLTSYIDGDQRGFIQNQNAYYWTGTPHASTSIRVLATRAGGEEMKLADYGFSILALVGLGLTGFSNLSTPNTYVGGSQFERTVYTDRNFDIVGVMQDASSSNLKQLRSDLAGILRPNAGIITQPLLLRIEPLDDCGSARGEIIEIPCTLEPNSLAGNWNNHFQDPITLSFHIYLPFLAAGVGTTGADLDFQQSVGTSSDYLLRRDASGHWTALAANDFVTSIVEGLDGNIYIGGNFTVIGSVTTSYIGYYNPNTGSFAAMGTGGAGGNVQTIARMPSGDIWAGGNFTSMGGVADTARIARWNGNAWNSVGTGGANGLVLTVIPGAVNIVYAGGSFTSIGGVASNGVSSYNGSTWTALGNPGGTVRTLALGANGTLYAGVDDVGLRSWNGTSWSTIAAATGGTADIYDITVGQDGILYITGNFTALGGISAVNVAKYDGVSITAMGDGLSGGTVFAQFSNASGSDIYTAGGFTSSGTLTFTRGFALWNGSTWVYGDAQSDSQNLISIIQSRDGSLYIGKSNGASTVTASFVNTLTNAGSADAYPVFTFTGPGSVYTLKNYSTGDVLYFNLVLNAGEIATLTLGPGNISFVSNFRGNIINTILPGSYLATFRLAPGDNSVSAFIAGTTSADTKLTAYWKTNYLSLDDALYK